MLMRWLMMWDVYSVASDASVVQINCSLWHLVPSLRIPSHASYSNGHSECDTSFRKETSNYNQYKFTEVLQGKTLCKLLRTKSLNKVKYKHRYCERYGNESSSHSQKLTHDSFCLQNFTFLYFVRLV
jgi:hypothetical protein